jgi:molybdopterin molybdotransferase
VLVAPVTFAEARKIVLREVRAGAGAASTDIVPLLEAAGRVLAEDVRADRDYPPVARSVRDGFALRSSDVPRDLRLIGEVRAGESFAGEVGPGETVEIMTGAPIPAGADAVVMIEHITRQGERISTDRTLKAGEAINPRGSEARAGDTVVPRGRRLDFAGIAMLATVGRSHVSVCRRPTVAILATGDEIVEIDQSPREFQVRNSNACSLAVQVVRAGGVPEILPVARDNYDSTRQLVERGLASDLLLLSGGVSAGKYDIVERVLADCGATFYFDRVLIQPGQPLVFGTARGRFFFGLPGNPASTMVTFEVFARAALELLGGELEPQLAITNAPLADPFRHRPGLTRFLPAVLNSDGLLTPIRWAGSSDVASITRANSFLVATPDRESWEKGDWIGVLLK